MARVFKEADDPAARFPDPDREVVSLDSDPRNFSSNCVTLKGEMLGLGPVELLGFARTRLNERNAMVERLLRWVPRKYEDRIKALAAPHNEAMEALKAVEILIENVRHAAVALEKPAEP